MDNWLLHQCRRICLRRLAAWSIAVAVSLVLAALNLRYIRDLVDGKSSVSTVDVLGIAASLALFVTLFTTAVPAWRRLQNPALHPVVARTATWGDPMTIAADIEKEYQWPQLRSENGWRLGDRYIVNATFFSINVLRLEDLLWAYKRVTKKSVNLIPVGKDYAAILICYGGGAVISGDERKIATILAHVTERAPWAFRGYSKDLDRVFRKKIRDFCQAVEARRREPRRGSSV